MYPYNYYRDLMFNVFDTGGETDVLGLKNDPYYALLAYSRRIPAPNINGFESNRLDELAGSLADRNADMSEYLNGSSLNTPNISLNQGLGLLGAGATILGNTLDMAKGAKNIDFLNEEARNNASQVSNATTNSSLEYDLSNLSLMNNQSYKDVGGISNGEIALGTGKNMMTGAMAGSQFGPIGAAVGAGVGLVSGLAGGLFGRNKAKRQQAELNNKIRRGNLAAASQISSRVDEIQKRNLHNNMMNYMSLGGNLFDNGGNLFQDNLIFDNNLMYVNEGGTHEENPYQGIPISYDQEGTPNLVEEGEVIAYGNYVFSNRIEVPEPLCEKLKVKKGSTFAQAVRKISKESEELPNDPIIKRGLDSQLQELGQAQEEIRELMKQREQMEQQFALGGNIFDTGSFIEPEGVPGDTRRGVITGGDYGLIGPQMPPQMPLFGGVTTLPSNARFMGEDDNGTRAYTDDNNHYFVDLNPNLLPDGHIYGNVPLDEVNITAPYTDEFREVPDYNKAAFALSKQRNRDLMDRAFENFSMNQFLNSISDYFDPIIADKAKYITKPLGQLVDIVGSGLAMAFPDFSGKNMETFKKVNDNIHIDSHYFDKDSLDYQPFTTAGNIAQAFVPQSTFDLATEVATLPFAAATKPLKAGLKGGRTLKLLPDVRWTRRVGKNATDAMGGVGKRNIINNPAVVNTRRVETPSISTRPVSEAAEQSTSVKVPKTDPDVPTAKTETPASNTTTTTIDDSAPKVTTTEKTPTTEKVSTTEKVQATEKELKPKEIKEHLRKHRSVDKSKGWNIDGKYYDNEAEAEKAIINKYGKEKPKASTSSEGTNVTINSMRENLKNLQSLPNSGNFFKNMGYSFENFGKKTANIFSKLSDRNLHDFSINRKNIHDLYQEIKDAENTIKKSKNYSFEDKQEAFKILQEAKRAAWDAGGRFKFQSLANLGRPAAQILQVGLPLAGLDYGAGAIFDWNMPGVDFRDVDEALDTEVRNKPNLWSKKETDEGTVYTYRHPNGGYMEVYDENGEGYVIIPEVDKDGNIIKDKNGKFKYTKRNASISKIFSKDDEEEKKVNKKSYLDKYIQEVLGNGSLKYGNMKENINKGVRAIEETETPPPPPPQPRKVVLEPSVTDMDAYLDTQGLGEPYAFGGNLFKNGSTTENDKTLPKWRGDYSHIDVDRFIERRAKDVSEYKKTKRGGLGYRKNMDPNYYYNNPLYNQWTDDVYDNWGNWGKYDELVRRMLGVYTDKDGNQYYFNPDGTLKTTPIIGSDGNAYSPRDFWRFERTNGKVGPHYYLLPEAPVNTTNPPTAWMQMPAPLGPENYDLSFLNNIDEKKEEKKELEKLPYLDDRLKYAPAFMSGANLLYNMLKGPDVALANANYKLANRIGRPQSIPVEVIGDYRKRDPYDERYLVNLNNQNANAFARQAVNTSGGNRASQIGYSNIGHFNQNVNNGEIMRQSYLANRQDDASVSDFNRATNIYNANANNQRNQYQAGLNSQNNDRRIQSLMQANMYKQQMIDNHQKAIYDDWSNIGNTLGDIGRLNTIENQRRFLVNSGAWFPTYKDYEELRKLLNKNNKEV